MLYRVHFAWVGFELTTLVVICTDYIGSYKSNYDTITVTTAPPWTYKQQTITKNWIQYKTNKATLVYKNKFSKDIVVLQVSSIV
jgi:hypothetical protein